MRRSDTNVSQELAVQTLNGAVNVLRAAARPLTDNEAKLIKKVEQINVLRNRGCENFTLCFKLSEAHWLYSSIKYDECFELYSSMHKGFMQLLENSATPIAHRMTPSVGLQTLLG